MESPRSNMPITLHGSYTDWQSVHDSFAGIPQSFYPQMSNIPFSISPTNVDVMQTQPLSGDYNSGARPTQDAIQPRWHSNGKNIVPTGYFDVNRSFHTWQHDDVELDSKGSSYLPRHNPLASEQDSTTLYCRWTGCEYSRSFASKGTLMRHIETMHVRNEKFTCSTCKKTFNRRDRHRTHVRMVHS